MHRLGCLISILLVLGTPQLGYADEPAPQSSPTASPESAGTLTPEQQAALEKEIVKASQNPVGNIASLPFQSNFNNGVGPNTALQYNLNFQPVVPIFLTPYTNLIARAIFPVIDNPSFAPPSACAEIPGGCGSTFGIGDLTMQLFVAPKTKPGALIWGIGPQLQFPTGSPSLLTSGKYSAGPAAVALVMPGSWVIGALTTQLSSYAGDATKQKVDLFSIEPFFNYNFGQAWTVSTGPTITANWAAAPNDRWTVPIGGGVSKTFKLGGQPMQLGLSYYTNIVRPANAPYNYVRFSWAILFPVKRGATVPK